jgi:hypothetical protein
MKRVRVKIALPTVVVAAAVVVAVVVVAAVATAVVAAAAVAVVATTVAAAVVDAIVTKRSLPRSARTSEFNFDGASREAPFFCCIVVNCPHHDLMQWATTIHPVLGSRLLTLLIAGWPAMCLLAQVGRSAKDCERQFGRHESGPSTNVSELAGGLSGDPPARVVQDYSWRGFVIRTLFVSSVVSDTRCVCLHFWHGGGPALTAQEINTLLAVNSEGSQWITVEGGWKRADNKALAIKATESLIVFTADFYQRDAPEILHKVLRSLPRELQPKRLPASATSAP